MFPKQVNCIDALDEKHCDNTEVSSHGKDDASESTDVETETAVAPFSCPEYYEKCPM